MRPVPDGDEMRLTSSGDAVLGEGKRDLTGLAEKNELPAGRLERLENIFRLRISQLERAYAVLAIGNECRMRKIFCRASPFLKFPLQTHLGQARQGHKPGDVAGGSARLDKNGASSSGRRIFHSQSP